MARVLVLYGSTEGQAATVAERVAEVLETSGHDPAVVHIRHRPESFDLMDYDAVVVGASVHMGKHQKYVTRYVKKHADELNRLPSAFFSVSLAAAEGSEEGWEHAREYVAEFLSETGWNPDETAVVPGALKYSQYGTLKRFVMKQIAKRMGGDTDTAHDYEYTDWNEVEGFTADFAGSLE
ncbi:flavodoxin/nitric oxide synthase [Haladaptatus paucihalophilus DX253]|uniref:Flavodoxin/nitric oxide synthase n=1 Tax=Haladaptatus paucihalophilus DX253 TaxID=797209 RepID=E7QV22_HALPU|nr:menaquinone-dependent protoporphyrinogen IX dehydrogenase [Haladaptatus paucihalophilus]EFW91540.1 flavodoxin/nitric oxide synthase [Haladaptatus paucihalophilus DX253]SHL25241.1 menaquinone-dependent protoporphyrinogen oxidase [Haladaptatus paucihalophilus DX253]